MSGGGGDTLPKELHITCNGIKGTLVTCRFGSGVRGQCIRFLAERTAGDVEKEYDGEAAAEWMTPREFEMKCGLGANRDWKKSIRCDGAPLNVLLGKRLPTPHHATCRCDTCHEPNNKRVVHKNSAPEVRQLVGFLKAKTNKYQVPTEKCSTCGIGEVNLFICSGCKMELYCSDVCQAREWSKHMHLCSSDERGLPRMVNLSPSDEILPGSSTKLLIYPQTTSAVVPSSVTDVNSRFDYSEEESD